MRSGRVPAVQNRTIIAAGFALASSGCSRPLSPDDFLTKAIQGDNSEISLGTLAERNGLSPQVRAYGATLGADHTAARTTAAKVASEHGVGIPSGLLPEAAEEANTLSGLSGADFDKEFASYMVKDHKSDISDFEAEEAGKAPEDIRSLARATLRDLRKHLAMAEQLK